MLATQPRYERLRLVLGENDTVTSSSIRQSLHDRGLRKVSACNHAEEVFERLDAEVVDLLIYDYDLEGDDFVQAMQRIRRKGRGKNPFLFIVATIRESAAETVQRLIGAGVDDLIRKPVSIERLFESIGTFSMERKPFFVSYNYVGPTRRSGARATEPASQILRAPNTLRGRSIDMISDEELERLVNSAIRNLDEKQLESCGIEIDVLAARVNDGFGTGATHEDIQDVRGSLFRLEVVANELRKRAQGTQFERVSELATMLLALTQRILRSQDATATIEVQLLTKLAAAIRRALSVERNSIEVMREISKTIAAFTRSH